MDKKMLKHGREFAKALADGEFEMTPSGIAFPKQSAHVGGWYEISDNRYGTERVHNLVPDEGILHILNVIFGGTPKAAAWYMAMFSGAITPAGNWTAANFASNATEITSNTEGYSQTTRPQFTTAAAAGNAIKNHASPAVFTIVCTTSITVNGFAILSSNVKGSTGGVLASAVRLPTARTYYNGDEVQGKYQFEMTG